MLFRELDRLEIKHRAWIKARKLVGSIVMLSKLLGIKRKRVSKWLSQPNTEIPYEYAVKVALLTNISLDKLSPYTKEINKFFKNPGIILEPVIDLFCPDLACLKTQYQAWQKIKKLFGSIAALSRFLGLDRRRVSKWLEKPKTIPYQYAVKTAMLLNLCLDELSPNTKELNKFFKNPGVVFGL